MSNVFELKTEKTNPEYAMSDYARRSKCFGVITESRYRSAEHERRAGRRKSINAVVHGRLLDAIGANSNIESLSVVGSVNWGSHDFLAVLNADNDRQAGGV